MQTCRLSPVHGTQMFGYQCTRPRMAFDSIRGQACWFTLNSGSNRTWNSNEWMAVCLKESFTCTG